jgi:predicted Zn-dependent peptidase
MSHEIKTAKGINQTSHIENAETSAVGRALAFLGYGIETSIASAEEVSQAIAQQKDKGDFQIFSGAFWEAKNLQDLNEIAANVKNYDWTAEERDQLAYVYKQVKGELEK